MLTAFRSFDNFFVKIFLRKNAAKFLAAFRFFDRNSCLTHWYLVLSYYGCISQCAHESQSRSYCKKIFNC